ncbi:hypothetical protein AB0J80_09340 [Actinoplanes sp. NPDC049548]|uniref:hypothetical protein n=1 Tax=Actinoplanes sp. NPDC049548 TaxID=3155152 RepID=UPI0034297F21
MTSEPSGQHRNSVDVRISLTDLAAVQWPARPLVGGGEPAPVEVPLPRLAWTRATTVRVPVGTGVAERIATVTRLQKLYEYVVIPVIALLFVLALLFLVLDWSDTVSNGRTVGGVLGLAAFVLVLLGYGPRVVAAVRKAPRVAGGELLLPSAHEDVAREAVALNPSGIVHVHSI